MTWQFCLLRTSLVHHRVIRSLLATWRCCKQHLDLLTTMQHIQTNLKLRLRIWFAENVRVCIHSICVMSLDRTLHSLTLWKYKQIQIFTRHWNEYTECRPSVASCLWNVSCTQFKSTCTVIVFMAEMPMKSQTTLSFCLSLFLPRISRSTFCASLS